MKKYRYFIAYNAEGNVIGMTNVVMNHKISTMQDIMDIADFISKKSLNNKKVVILNWKRLKND